MLSGIIFLIILLWAASIGFVYWDVYRRNLPYRRQVVWLTTVALLPLLGVTVYLYARFIHPALKTRRPVRSGLQKRVTLPMHVPQDQQQLPTIAMAELARPARADGAPFQAAGNGRQRHQIYRLAIVAGPGAGREIVLPDLPASIGRGINTTIRLENDTSISRQHAEVYEQGGKLYLRDLNSTHGTYINGRRISAQRLEHDDRIKVGQTVLLFQAKAGKK